MASWLAVVPRSVRTTEAWFIPNRMAQSMANNNSTVSSGSDRCAVAEQAGQPKTGRNLWLNLLCVTLLGYALFGKGWAYLGLPPIFIGEVVLLLGIATAFTFARWSPLLQSEPLWPLALMAIWGLYCTWPFIGDYGADALRDAAIWGYSGFAVVVFLHVCNRPERLASLVNKYRQFARIFLVAIPVVWLLCQYRANAIPTWPWADVQVIDAKGGDVAVHLAGVIAFWAVGLAPGVSYRWLVLFAATAAMVGSANRGGMASLLAAVALCMLFRPLNRPTWRLAMTSIAALLLLAALDVRLKVPDSDREISVAQLMANVTSVTSQGKNQTLDSTKQWRIQWWTDIVNYTLYGKYFWTGKGFGINLADADGYQGTAWSGRLRSPHNGHLTMLARAGVPGVVLWILVHLVWSVCIYRAFSVCSRCGDHTWASLFLFLLAYWLAFMINASFDVFIEGPMGGIWLWTLYGVGLAALWIYRFHPEVLANLQNCQADKVTDGP